DEVSDAIDTEVKELFGPHLVFEMFDKQFSNLC
ncbi:unnamed protein product, partial [marine sediment metagenome]